MAMSRSRTIALTSLAMLAFAANSLICRLALKTTAIDPSSFTLIRIASGAAVLCLLVRWRSGALPKDGSWLSASALFAYAAAFSFAYAKMTAATGALLLFGAVQITMIGVGLWRGERFRGLRLFGMVAACLGLLALLLPGASVPSMDAALLMLGAGIAWGVYSLRGKGAADPAAVNAGSFLRATALALGMSLVALRWASIDTVGVAYAILSGAVTSGLGYIIWYQALRGLSAIDASTVQLSVPVIAAIGGILLLGEAITLHLIVCAAAILGGVAIVIHQGGKPG